MGRERCTMNHCIDEECYCDYYDFGCMKCSDIEECPDGYDFDDDIDDDIYEDEWDDECYEDEEI